MAEQRFSAELFLQCVDVLKFFQQMKGPGVCTKPVRTADGY